MDFAILNFCNPFLYIEINDLVYLKVTKFFKPVDNIEAVYLVSLGTSSFPARHGV